MRHDWIGTDACRNRSKLLADPEKNKIYRGLATLTAELIRSTGAEVIDSRSFFLGHADIKHGFVTKIGEPLAPDILLAMRTRNKRLAKIANYFSDPNPESITWGGAALNLP
ncbi:MAG: hypothetical protein PHI97_31510 [Desulfobulbus sp.]|nr:hypothetical protein [Desulfobulbus sp.]